MRKRRSTQYVFPQLGKKGKSVRFSWVCDHCEHRNSWKWKRYEWVGGPCHMQCDACGLVTVVELVGSEGLP